MNQWSNALQSLAPAAGKPGTGSGNVPFAPGLMSGKFQGLTQNSQDLYGKLAQSQPTQAPTQNVGGVQMPTAGPGQPGPMVWGPEQQAATLQYLMSLLQPNAPKMKMTTTGGFIPKPDTQY